MRVPSADRDETFAIATMHGKKHAVDEPPSRWLGAAMTVVPGIDTDAFGTFTGEIVRHGTIPANANTAIPEQTQLRK